jgi:polyvinyl alcohol dehydrogenase (cytochrome)
MYALDASTGKILWSYASGGAELAGASIVGGTVYWGSGYHNGDNDKLYAFTLDGH